MSTSPAARLRSGWAASRVRSEDIKTPVRATGRGERGGLHGAAGPEGRVVEEIAPLAFGGLGAGGVQRGHDAAENALLVLAGMLAAQIDQERGGGIEPGGDGGGDTEGQFGVLLQFLGGIGDGPHAADRG